MKFLLKSVLVFLLAFAFFNVNLKQADAYSICSASETRCAHTFLFYNKDKSSSTNTVYFSKGETIWFSWSNESPGIFHTNVAVYKGTKQITTGYKSIPSLGLDGGNVSAPESGYYHLVALCSAGDQNRCEGGGKIFYQ